MNKIRKFLYLHGADHEVTISEILEHSIFHGRWGGRVAFLAVILSRTLEIPKAGMKNRKYGLVCVCMWFSFYYFGILCFCRGFGTESGMELFARQGASASAAEQV